MRRIKDAKEVRLGPMAARIGNPWSVPDFKAVELKSIKELTERLEAGCFCFARFKHDSRSPIYSVKRAIKHHGQDVVFLSDRWSPNKDAGFFVSFDELIVTYEEERIESSK